jgi:hypothetical protein
MEEEEIRYHEQTAQNLAIETGLEGIDIAKRSYNDTTLSQNALKEIEMKKLTLMVYTDGSVIGEERGVGAKGFEERHNLIGAEGDRNCN